MSESEKTEEPESNTSIKFVDEFKRGFYDAINGRPSSPNSLAYVDGYAHGQMALRGRKEREDSQNT